ncbi:MAG: TRAP transporter substrate-binding protein DctP [Salinisphaeraceae bacterium]|nr:TRAP transporter substrate-binding protein DctP [Salinisphaeraceae bacterium]
MPYLARIAALCLLLGLSTAHATTFKIATIAPDGTGWMREMRAGAKQVEKETQGRVKFKFYPGGVMGNDDAVMRKIRVGQLHGGAFATTGLTNIYKDAALYSYPLQFRNLTEVDYVRSRMDAQLANGLEAGGMVPLGFSEGGFTYLMGQEPIESVDDLEGKKVWVPEDDPINENAIKNAGVTPVPLPFSDVYTGLQTGLIDTVAAVPTGAIAFQWHTKLKSLADVPLNYILGALVVSKRSFSKLSAEDQQTVRKIMGEVFTRLNRINRQDNQKAREALRNQDIVFTQLSAEEQAEWRAMADKAINDLRSSGLYTPAVLDEMRRHIKAARNQP